MTNTFSESKYQDAAAKCISFIERQMNVNNFTHSISFGKEYGDNYSGDVIWGEVKGFTGDEDQVGGMKVTVPEYYPYSYTGTVSGGANVDGDYAVNVYVIRDSKYKVITCPINGGNWKSAMTYRETYLVPDYDEEGQIIGEHTEVVTYDLDVGVGEGIKEFRLARGVTSHWEDVSSPGAEYQKAERLVYNAAEEILPEDGGRPYRYLSYFTVRLYSYSDSEYLNEECKIWNVGGGKYIWYTNKVYKGHKIGKVMQQVWRDGKTQYDTIGIAGAVSNIEKGRLPASFLIPSDDPQYDKDGSNAKGLYGYCLNARTWAYDVGLALLVFTTSHNYDICKEMLNRMVYEQNSDGSFNFSYDIYIGQMFEGYVRTGAMGWLLWGMCYYTLETGDRSYIEMIKKGGEWMLSRQITDKKDPRYGLMTGGKGSYNMEDYSYIDEDIKWCSVEHQCSGLQALEGCSLVLNEKKYKEAAELVRERLFIKCYDKVNGRFYQGIDGSVPDSAWALDCTTWAGNIIFSVLNKETAKACFKTAKEVFLTEGKMIIQSRSKDYYNTTYSSSDKFSGFKPYSDKTRDYEGAPDIVWTEGTLGYASLALVLGYEDEAKKYVDECIALQNCKGSTGGVIYTTATYGMLPWEFHVWESVVSSSWLYLVIKNPDVLFPRTLRQVHNIEKIINKDSLPDKTAYKAYLGDIPIVKMYYGDEEVTEIL